MKKVTKISIILAAFAAQGLTSIGQKSSLTPLQKPTVYSIPVVSETDPQFIQGAITVKLKAGVGNYNKQTGLVTFGISSLDQKVAAFEVFQLEKRFKYNSAKLRPDLPDLSRIYKLSFPEKFPVEEVALVFASDPNVEYAEAIPLVHAADVPNDSLFAQLQHLPHIFAPQAWDIHKGENGTEEIIIAIIDTGVDWDHVDLRENIWQNMAEDADNDGHTMDFIGGQWILDPGDLNGVDDDGNGFTDDLLGWNFITSTGNPNPIQSNPLGWHGTHCSGIAAARTNNGAGVASISWNLTLMPICVDQSNSFPYAYDGIIYAAENGADIISNSWAGNISSIAEQEVVNYATGLGSIVVAAAANNNSTQLMYPASYKNVISVASVNSDDTKAHYSTYNLSVDVSAPGGGSEGEMLSTVPGGTYGLASGTSMATPCVAGCIGLLKSYHPEWTNDQLITQLLGAADNIDSLNPDYINALGIGRVNAYRMLTETVQPFIKMVLLSFSSNDANGNLINEPGETFSLNINLLNQMQCNGSDNVDLTLLTDDPEITIIEDTYTTNIPADSSFVIENQFQVQVAANAHSHYAKLILHFDTDLTVIGQDLELKVLVAPSGIFVFEGEENERDYSGTFITDFLDHLGFEYTYSNSYPATLRGFETVFLSHGNFGKMWNKGTMFTQAHSVMVEDFLENGGNLFIDAGGLFTRIIAFNYPNKEQMKQLFGVESVQLSNVQNPIDTLSGVENTPFEEMLFIESNQFYNWYIDKLIPAAEAIVPFYENYYGNVSIMNDLSASYGGKAFYLGYSLSELSDGDALVSKYNLLLKIMDFFGYSLPQGYLLSNFIPDKTVGPLPLEVQFTDITISDPAYPIASWQWDFDNDGIIDSYDQNPVWTYVDSTSYDVRLITSNGYKSDTLVQQRLITINYGYLVYDGDFTGNDYSGAFIRDYLLQQGYTVSYRDILPENLKGSTAVFLSFGNYGSGYTPLDDQMAVTIVDYITNGGCVYLEGDIAIGYDQSTNIQLRNSFGLLNVTIGAAENPIDFLSGGQGTLTHDMVFTSNSQTSNAYIDKYTASNDENAAFMESNYGCVGVEHTGDNGCKTFCFSYALAKLNDGEFPNTREELLNRILNFFDTYTGEKEKKETKAGNLLIYPNPGHESVTISLPEINKTRLLSIFNVRGEKVIERQLTNRDTQLDISALPRGVYFVRLQNDKILEVGKMVKE